MEEENLNRRIYIVSKKNEEGKDFFVGAFSNRKIVFENLQKLGLEGCFINGARKRKEVLPETISTGFVGRGLTIYKEDAEQEVSHAYKVLEIRLNEVNPFFKKKENVE